MNYIIGANHNMCNMWRCEISIDRLTSEVTENSDTSDTSDTEPHLFNVNMMFLMQQGEI
jgi:hypothetical protein